VAARGAQQDQLRRIGIKYLMRLKIVNGRMALASV